MGQLPSKNKQQLLTRTPIYAFRSQKDDRVVDTEGDGIQRFRPPYIKVRPGRDLQDGTRGIQGTVQFGKCLRRCGQTTAGGLQFDDLFNTHVVELLHNTFNALSLLERTHGFFVSGVLILKAFQGMESCKVHLQIFLLNIRV